MTTNRDKLAALDTEIASVAEKQSDLSHQDYELRESRINIIKDIISEEKPFEGTTWELFVGVNNSIFFQYMEGNEDKMEALRGLCFQSWHDRFEFSDGIILQFDDGVYSLVANDPNQFKDFVQHHNLTIIASDAVEKIKRLSRQLTSLQEICRQFNLKV